jgi:4-aminobutyrate aminotransferase-like enzyme
VQTKTLFDQEQEFIAPGIQTIALVSRLAIDHGCGATLTDCDGRTYLDLNAGVSVASLGHTHPKYVAALTEQLRTLTVGSFTSRPRAELVRLIAELTPVGLKRTQLFSSGAEAVEAAIRLARSFTKRSDIIGFTGGFHGKTAGVLPISDIDWKQAVGPLAPGYYISRYPDLTDTTVSPSDHLKRAIKDLRGTIQKDAKGKPAAILIEPIQGTAGNIIPPDHFLSEVKNVAREYGALLIADEMITGFGRTGQMFACNREDVVPDILVLGKGMASGFPVSAVVSTDEITSAKPFSLPSASSSSYGGNPFAAAAALVTIRTIISDRLVENSARVGDIFLQGLQTVASKHASIANVRGRGLLIGFDLVSPRDKTLLPKHKCVEFFRDCLASGLILMGYTPRVRVHPPLILTEEEAKRALTIIDEASGRLDKSS